jgi:hypothetical protein
LYAVDLVVERLLAAPPSLQSKFIEAVATLLEVCWNATDLNTSNWKEELLFEVWQVLIHMSEHPKEEWRSVMRRSTRFLEVIMTQFSDFRRAALSVRKPQLF